MGCYIIPAAAAVIHLFYRKRLTQRAEQHRWLNLLFLGGAIFGVIDHLWNGELFHIGYRDMLLGLVITIVIWSVWQVIVWHDRSLVKDAEISR